MSGKSSLKGLLEAGIPVKRRRTSDPFLFPCNVELDGKSLTREGWVTLRDGVVHLFTRVNGGRLKQQKFGVDSVKVQGSLNVFVTGDGEKVLNVRETGACGCGNPLKKVTSYAAALAGSAPDA